MLARLPSLIPIRLAALLLLATVLLQAALPASAPLQQNHGSAFTAATYEVALAVSRNEKQARQAVPQLPPALLAIPAPAPSLAPVPARLALPAPRPDSTAPPPYAIRAWRPAPRAPPAA
jgi:hypothetical protein